MFTLRCCFMSSCALVALIMYMYSTGTPWTHRETIRTIRTIRQNGDDLSRSFTKCTSRKKTELMTSALSMNSDGEVDLNETSGCFVVNSNKSRIFRIFHRGNFMDTKCPPVRKRFLNVTGKEINTALASISGSGNTWTRHLIEEMTGIYTGSIYGKLVNVFKGDRTRHNVVVVKTHQKHLDSYDRAVIIVRDPFEFTLSEFNKLTMASKTGILPESKFNIQAFHKSLKKQLNENKVVGWINNFKGDLFILYYEKLKTDLPNSLLKLAWFLGAEVNLERLWCTEVNKDGSFKRKEEKPSYMSRKVLVNTETELRIQKWKQDIQDALMCRSLHWSSS